MAVIKKFDSTFPHRYIMKLLRILGLWIGAARGDIRCDTRCDIRSGIRGDIRRKSLRMWHVGWRRHWARACCSLLLTLVLVSTQLLLPILLTNVPGSHANRSSSWVERSWNQSLWAQDITTPIPSSNIATPVNTAVTMTATAGFTPVSTTTVSITATVAPPETVSPDTPEANQLAEPTAVPVAPTAVNTPTADAAALVQQQLEAQLDAFLQMMSPEERVGQLFAINILGNQITADSDIAELIYEYHIGSVILTPDKENFTNAKGTHTPENVAILANQLQALAYGYLLPADQALLPNPLPAVTTQPADQNQQSTAIANVPTMTETLTVTSSAVPTQPLLSLTPLSPPEAAPATAERSSVRPVQIPLFIGIEQLGDGYPTTALRRNFTPLPSQLALGSTWNPQLVHDVGAVVGRELNAVGINLLLGPSLDVVNQPRLDPVGALGIHSFGGDPYWVSQMGSAFISGVHEGSNYGLAAIARHFPGQGDIDRLPEEEVATVQQTLPELQQVALPPFTQVTRDISHVIDPTAANDTVDGLMTSHMRFRAFQGTSSTRIAPIGFSPELKIALEQVNIAGWHNDGGILMTPPLGTPAIRRYYQVPQQESPYRIIALNAFDAGHDLIYLAQLSPENDWEVEKRYIKDVIQFFQERYRTDAEFQTQIDVAVRRILRLKYNLYRNGLNAFGDESLFPLPTFSEEAQAQQLVPLDRLLVQADDLAIFQDGTNHRQAATATIGQVARESITLLYPDLASFSSAVPAPQLTDKLLIFSDSRLFQECAECTAETALGPEELKSIITRLYGTEPGATGQIVPDQVSGRSFTELKTLLDARNADAAQSSMATPQSTTDITTTMTTTGGVMTGQPSAAGSTGQGSDGTTLLRTPPATSISGEEADNAENLVEQPRSANEHLQQLIDESNWIIFAMLDVDPENSPASDVVKEFLRQESEQLTNKQVIVLALNAPYFLDATEISKLTAYIGVYSKIQPFLESAVRVLFRSYSPVGAPAVSVAGTRFGSLAERLEADPDAAIPLTIEVNGELIELSPDGNTPVVDAGSLLRMQVLQIRDRNGHLVPDGTPVQFHLVYENPELTVAVDPVLTRNGSASKEVLLTQPGRLSLSASVGEASTENTRLLSINDPDAEATSEPVAVAATSPAATTTVITTTVAPTATTTGGDTTAVANADPGLTPLEPSATGTAVQIDWKTLLIALFTIAITLCMLLILQIHLISRTVLVRNMLWATIFGLGAYIFYALGILPGAGYLSISFRHWGAAVVVFIGMLLPLLWLQLHMEETPRAG